MHKAVIITGANRGLGFHAARALIARPEGWKVILAVRDVPAGHAAAARLGAPHRTEVLACNLASLASVRQAAAKLTDRDDVAGVVANAGVQLADTRRYTADGFELTFGTNHLGHFLLIELLRQRLSPPARLVIVSSGVHRPQLRKRGPIPRPQWHAAEELARPGALANGRVAYTTSKLANALYVTALAGQGANAVAFDPTLLPGTDLARHAPPAVQWLWHRVLPAFTPLLPFASRPQAAGDALARLIVDRNLAHLRGAFVELDHVEPASAEARDPVRAQELMEGSARLVGLGDAASHASRPMKAINERT
jgi:NAD(P)-dependent dehydrogenase (short-subunit alcohol dehydrogenase family)